jgi:hypothetical protein
MDMERLVPFLIRAKQHTYASGKAPDASSRPGSHDLHYTEENLQYIDTYLGGFYFIGEEAVWVDGTPVWGMNYYGKMLVETIPAGFGDFLKAALLRVPAEAPFRGPKEFCERAFSYHCQWSGAFEEYEGEEKIMLGTQALYHLYFHGGEIR